ERLERLVDYYMGFAPGDAGLEVLSISEILTDQDLAKITEICTTYNLRDFSAPVPDATEQEAAPQAAPSPWDDAPTPDIREMGQKGLGLRTLKKTLSLFDDIPDAVAISGLSVEERREVQSRLERDTVDAAMQRWKEEYANLQKMGASDPTISLNK